MIKQTTLKATGLKAEAEPNLFDDPFNDGKAKQLQMADIESVPELPRDKDGCVIPLFYQGAVKKWEGFPLLYRVRRAQEYLDDLKREAGKKPKQQRAKAANTTKFSTKKARAWVKRKGWDIVTGETWKLVRLPDGRMIRKSNDSVLKSDVVCSQKGVPGLILVQAGGASKSERKTHYDTFQALNGPDKCRERGYRYVWVPFDRFQDEPVYEPEWWA